MLSEGLIKMTTSLFGQLSELLQTSLTELMTPTLNTGAKGSRLSTENHVRKHKVKREEQEEQPTQTNRKTHIGETQEGKKLRNIRVIQKLNAMRGSARLMLSKQCQLIETLKKSNSFQGGGGEDPEQYSCVCNGVGSVKDKHEF